MTQSDQRMQALERLSALADGEADASAMQWASGAWRDDPGLRERWRSYHLIGDVLRSEELGSEPGHDEGFLKALRVRLADEPVVMAPRPAAAPVVEAPAVQASPGLVRAVAVRQRRRMWTASAAVAAGFVAVAGVLLVTQEVPADGSATLAAAGTGAPPAALPAAPLAVSNGQGPVLYLTGNAPVVIDRTPAPAVVERSPAPVFVTDGRMLRDPRIDRYLAAHRQFNGTALGVPSGFLRGETVGNAKP